ncbi:MAG: hypothetical protein V3U57_02030 [Robiginitomaculum sp.]
MTTVSAFFSLVAVKFMLENRFDTGYFFIVSMLATSLATFISARLCWHFIMRSGESKKKGAICGGGTVFLAYFFMAFFVSTFTIINNPSHAEGLKIVQQFSMMFIVISVFSIIVTGWASIPIGWFIGTKIAHNHE